MHGDNKVARADFLKLSSTNSKLMCPVLLYQINFGLDWAGICIIVQFSFLRD